MRRIFLFIIIIFLMSYGVMASGSNIFSTCFNYEGEGMYFLEHTDIGPNSEINVEDLGTTIRITTILNSLVKPFLAFKEKDRDGDGIVEVDELRSDGIDITYGSNIFEWKVFGGSQDPEITVAGYPGDITFNPITYTFEGPEPASGEEVCLDVHASPNGKCLTSSDCNGLLSISLYYDPIADFEEGDEIKVEVYKGSKIRDIETGTVASSSIDDNSGTKANLILDDIRTDGMDITIEAIDEEDKKGNKKRKLDSETKIRVYLNEDLIAEGAVHTSCSKPIDVGDTFTGSGLFTITSLDKIFKGGGGIDLNGNGIDDACEIEECPYMGLALSRTSYSGDENPVEVTATVTTECGGTTELWAFGFFSDESYEMVLQQVVAAGDIDLELDNNGYFSYAFFLTCDGECAVGNIFDPLGELVLAEPIPEFTGIGVVLLTLIVIVGSYLVITRAPMHRAKP